MSIRRSVRAIVVATPLLFAAACAGDAPTAIRQPGAPQLRKGGEGETGNVVISGPTPSPTTVRSTVPSSAPSFWSMRTIQLSCRVDSG